MMTVSSDSDQHVVMLRILVALVIWLYFMRIINCYALKVGLELKLRGQIETGVQWDGDMGDI